LGAKVSQIKWIILFLFIPENGMRKQNKKKLLLFSIITIVLVLIVLELIFRIAFAVQYGGYHTSVYVQGNTLQVSDSQLVFKNRPFYLDYHKRYQFNEEGMRVKAGNVFMPKKGPDDYWVFLFGGSAMEGAGSNKDGEWLDITGIEDHDPGKTIAHFLQEYLQENMPGRKVTVFNAANSGYSILQSMRRYQELSAKYQMDYVISLDGENEPAKLAPGQSVDAYIRERWNSSALFRFPLNVIVPMTSHSAFINKMKQLAFHLRHERRMKNNLEKDFPARAKWFQATAAPLKYNDSEVDKAVDSFNAQLRAFDSLLASKNQPHKLYVQSHLTLKDTLQMTPRELALYKYYTVNYNDPYQNSFKRKLRTRFSQCYLPAKEFVDYCHFTEKTNELIAHTIGAEILTNHPRN
jgi:hypothetical protein